MPFTFPETFKNTTATGAPKSASTLSVYRKHISRISDETGITTIDGIIENPLAVLAAIQNLTPLKEKETDNQRNTRLRVFFSALFTFLPAEYIAKSNPFYEVFQTLKK
jgi:site-specific recombinase XerD